MANRGYDPKEVHLTPERLVNHAAQSWTVENLGGDPKTQNIYDLYESQTEDLLNDELKGWTRVAKSAVRELVKRGGPLTIEALDPISREDKHAKLY